MLRKLYMTGIERSSRSFSLLPQAIENSRQFCFSEQIFYRKQPLGAPAPLSPAGRACSSATICMME